MIKSWQHLVRAVILAVGGTFLSASSVLAQSITIDGTLSPAQTLTGPVYTIPQSVGQTVGSNLFHSFGRFNLNVGERANFGSAGNIRNILSRVTGGSASMINGLIFTNSANVNLFLINPSGIVFGPNASLNVGGSTRGSFVATTVDALVWSNGSQFSATNPGGASSLLTIVGDPSGFLSTLRTPPPIDVNRSALGVYEGQSLLLLGGNVSLESRILAARGGRVELGGLAEPGTVGLQVDGNNLSLSFPDGVVRSDVSLANSAVDVSTGGGGSIGINARNVDILRGSLLQAGIYPGFGEPNAKAGNIEINAQEKVSLNNSAIRNSVIGNVFSNFFFPEALGQAGDIIINTGSLLVTNNAVLDTSVTGGGKGNAGNIIINARGQVSFDGGFALSRLEVGGEGRGGDIRITTDGDVLVTGIPSNVASSNIGQLVTATFGNGDAGSVTIKAGGNVSFDGIGSDIFTLVAQDRGVGNAGNITIDSNSLSVTNGARLISSTEQQGNAGNITIDSNSLLVTNGAQLASNTRQEGDAGSINITTRDTIKLVGGASISTNVLPGGNGSAGNINIKTGSLSLTDGAVLNSSTSAQGSAGNLMINVGSLLLSDGAALTASTSGQGNAGNVIIDASDRISFDDSSAFSDVAQTGTGKGGDIRITTNSLDVTNGAQLLASTSGEGDAGDVQIKAFDSVNISGTNSINGRSSGLVTSTTTNSQGNGGDIRVYTSVFRLSDGAVLNARTVTDGNGGNITVNASQFQALNGGQLVSTTSSTGRAGQITVNATDRVIINGSDPTFNDRLARFGKSVIANPDAASGFFVQSSGSGIAGDIEVTSPQVRLDNGGRFIAESASGNGGNIGLEVGDLLLLRRGSLISATAGTNQAGGNGGNISINSPFIVAVPQENSDIRANAFSGNGGTVTINAQGIFGIQSRQQPTSQSDITASSTGGGIDGVVDINTLDIDPNRGFINLPTNVVNTLSLVAQSCSAFGKKGSEFIVTGRGGLPLGPDDFLSSDVVWSDTRLTALPVLPSPGVTRKVRKTADGVAIVPATGWVFDEKKGEVTLIASNGNSESVGSNQVKCIVP
jgi:filamentous hemagglutinin family protein